MRSVFRYNTMRLEDEIHQTEFSNPRLKLAVNLIYTGNWFGHHNNQWVKPFGLTPQQYNILRIVRGHHPEPIRIQAIQDRMLDKMSNVSRIVERLRKKGLIDRQTCPSDRRAMDVTITGDGLAMLNRIDEDHARLLGPLQTLAPEEVERLNHLLDKLRG